MLDFRLPALDEEYFVPIDGAEAGEAAPDAADGAGADTAAEARPSRSSAIDPALGPAGSPGQGDSLPAPSEAAPSPTVIDLSSETPPEPAERIWADNDIRFRSRINVLPSPLFSRQAIWPNVGWVWRLSRVRWVVGRGKPQLTSVLGRQVRAQPHVPRADGRRSDHGRNDDEAAQYRAQQGRRDDEPALWRDGGAQRWRQRISAGGVGLDS